jgi:hypothetical protein
MEKITALATEKKDAAHFRKELQRLAALAAADAVATVASSTLGALDELVHEDSLNKNQHAIIQATINAIIKARELAYGLSIKEAEASHHINPKSAADSIKKQRVKLGLED